MGFTWAPGVSACRADGVLVILNVRADRYIMLPRNVEASLVRLIDNEPALSPDAAIRERLCTNGLILQRSEASGLELCSEPLPARSLLDSGWKRPRPDRVITAAWQTAKAIGMLRIGGLPRALARVSRFTPPRNGDAKAVLRAAAAFAELRLLVRALDRCLPLSLALAAAAKPHHADVRLVLGVACHPFRAHAWTQLRSVVLNDRLDTVRAFTPILAL